MYGPLLRVAPATLGTLAAILGTKTAPRATSSQCSLFGLSDPPDPPYAAPFERAAA